jgi:hypothetical protein
MWIRNKRVDYRVHLLSFAKQVDLVAGYQIYHYFFNSPLAAKGKRLSEFYRHFIKMLVIYAVGLYKMQYHIKSNFIGQVMDLLQITNNFVQELTIKFIELYIENINQLLSKLLAA